MEAAFDHGYADPRRLHGPARNARLLLDNARQACAEVLEVRADEVTFVPSGTHAVHSGLLGLVVGRRTVSRRVLHSAVEHSAVLTALAWAESAYDAAAVPVGVDSVGRVDPEELLTEAGEDCGVIALQSANHEVGTRQPVSTVAAAAADHGIPVFVDACASAGREALPDGWSVAAASAHKWGGPAGVGLLLVRKGARWRPALPGDDRGDPRSVGFENVAAALGAAAALQAVVAERGEVARRQHEIVARLRARVAAEVPDVEVVGDPDDRLPHLVTFSCLYVDGEALVTELDRRGLAVASGSACTSSTLEPSHVLAAMGALTHGNVRVSVGRDTTAEDVDALADTLPAVVAELRGRAGLR